jgi:hypothetical protein
MPFLYFVQDEGMGLVRDTKVFAKSGIIYLPAGNLQQQSIDTVFAENDSVSNTWFLPRQPPSHPVSATIGKHKLYCSCV